MSWIFWVLIGIVGVVTYINIGYLFNWVGEKEVGNKHWLVRIFFPAPESFGVKGVFNPSGDGPDNGEGKWEWILFWPFWLCFIWTFCLIDWVLVLFRTLARGIKAIPETKAFNIVFKGGWLMKLK